jgi:hypothetical protein
MHMDLFRRVNTDVYPQANYAWTRIGVSELAHPGLLAEVVLPSSDNGTCVVANDPLD